jgi:hypothetical protein
MEGPVNRGDVHVGIRFFGSAKDFVHPHMSATIGNYGENQYSLGGEAVALLPESIDCLLTLYHSLSANKGSCNRLCLHILSNCKGLSRQIIANTRLGRRSGVV